MASSISPLIDGSSASTLPSRSRTTSLRLSPDADDERMRGPQRPRRTASLGGARALPVGSNILEAQELQQRFDALQQADLPLHMYANRVLGVSSRLAAAGIVVKGSRKIEVLLDGLDERHEDIRQLLLTKVRRWRASAEMDDEDRMFETLVALIRRYAFEREGEEKSLLAASSSSSIGSPCVSSDSSSTSSSQGASSLAITMDPRHSVDTGSSPASSTEEWRAAQPTKAAHRRSENLMGTNIHAILGFTVARPPKRGSAHAPHRKA